MAPAKKSKPKSAPKAAKKAPKPAKKPAAKAKSSRAAAPKMVAHSHAAHRPAAKSRAQSPSWVDEALRYAQKNPAVTVVAIIAALVGLILMLD